MRILLTADPIGGVWSYALELCEALRPLHASVALVTLGRSLTASQRAQLEPMDHVTLYETKFRLEFGIPLVTAPWDDCEGLFEPGKDYLVAQDGVQMRAHLQSLCRDRGYAESLSRHGLQTIRARHTCAHRVRELLSICRELVAQE